MWGVTLPAQAPPCPQPNCELGELAVRGHAILPPAAMFGSATIAELLEEAGGELPRWGNIFNDTPPYTTRKPDSDARQAAYARDGSGKVPPGGPYHNQGGATYPGPRTWTLPGSRLGWFRSAPVALIWLWLVSLASGWLSSGFRSARVVRVCFHWCVSSWFGSARFGFLHTHPCPHPTFSGSASLGFLWLQKISLGSGGLGVFPLSMTPVGLAWLGLVSVTSMHALTPHFLEMPHSDATPATAMPALWAAGRQLLAAVQAVYPDVPLHINDAAYVRTNSPTPQVLHQDLRTGLHCLALDVMNSHGRGMANGLEWQMVGGPLGERDSMRVSVVLNDSRFWGREIVGAVVDHPRTLSGLVSHHGGNVADTAPCTRSPGPSCSPASSC